MNIFRRGFNSNISRHFTSKYLDKYHTFKKAMYTYEKTNMETSLKEKETNFLD